MTQTITAMYDKEADAQAAMNKLLSAGIERTAIRLVAGSAKPSGTTSYDHTRDEGGFWGSLKEIFLPEEDRYAYTEGLSRGGTMLTVTAQDAQVEKVYDILEEHGSVDLDERQAAWRQEGWGGYSSGTPGTTATTGAMRNPTMTDAAGGIPAAGTAAYAAGTADTAATDKDYIPVVEERLNVGKRVASSGRVRVRSYVVEKPVEEQVTLREETVHVDRRPVDRAPTATDEALFQDKVIEATETREEAVVNKDARIVEEVGIRKDAGQRTETVADKVRRTEVEVEDERGNVSRTGTTGTAETGIPGTRKPV
ncbi:YsnF/AvaK domain-containing protein [Methylobacterium sp. P31]